MKTARHLHALAIERGRDIMSSAHPSEEDHFAARCRITVRRRGFGRRRDGSAQGASGASLAVRRGRIAVAREQEEVSEPARRSLLRAAREADPQPDRDHAGREARRRIDGDDVLTHGEREDRDRAEGRDPIEARPLTGSSRRALDGVRRADEHRDDAPPARSSRRATPQRGRRGLEAVRDRPSTRRRRCTSYRQASRSASLRRVCALAVVSGPRSFPHPGGSTST